MALKMITNLLCWHRWQFFIGPVWQYALIDFGFDRAQRSINHHNWPIARTDQIDWTKKSPKSTGIGHSERLSCDFVVTFGSFMHIFWNSSLFPFECYAMHVSHYRIHDLSSININEIRRVSFRVGFVGRWYLIDANWSPFPVLRLFLFDRHTFKSQMMCTHGSTDFLLFNRHIQMHW